MKIINKPTDKRRFYWYVDNDLTLHRLKMVRKKSDGTYDMRERFHGGTKNYSDLSRMFCFKKNALIYVDMMQQTKESFSKFIC